MWLGLAAFVVAVVLVAIIALLARREGAAAAREEEAREDASTAQAQGEIMVAERSVDDVADDMDRGSF